jgi:hypothetical protein
MERRPFPVNTVPKQAWWDVQGRRQTTHLCGMCSDLDLYRTARGYEQHSLELVTSGGFHCVLTAGMQLYILLHNHTAYSTYTVVIFGSPAANPQHMHYNISVRLPRPITTHFHRVDGRDCSKFQPSLSPFITEAVIHRYTDIGAA